MSYTDLSEQFNHQFEIVLASNDFLRDDVYRMRYEVYCEELGYESPGNFPDNREMDSFDQNSIHCLLKHKATGLWAGCVRLVLPNNRLNSLEFPFQKLFGSFSEITQNTPQEMRSISTSSMGEVSRLAVPAHFRRRKSDRHSSYGTTDITSPPARQQRQFPIIPMSLYLAASTIALNQGLEYVVTMMEPRLVRHLRYFGIRFESISELIEFNGKRGLFMISRQSLLDNIRPDCHELMILIQDQLLEVSKLGTQNQEPQPLVISCV